MNPEYPGVFDLAAWEIGRTWCKATRECGKCGMGGVCLTQGSPMRCATATDPSCGRAVAAIL